VNVTPANSVAAQTDHDSGEDHERRGPQRQRAAEDRRSGGLLALGCADRLPTEQTYEQGEAAR
jgi:hypothetical protein